MVQGRKMTIFWTQVVLVWNFWRPQLILKLEPLLLLPNNNSTRVRIPTTSIISCPSRIWGYSMQRARCKFKDFWILQKWFKKRSPTSSQSVIKARLLGHLTESELIWHMEVTVTLSSQVGEVGEALVDEERNDGVSREWCASRYVLLLCCRCLAIFTKKQ